MNTFERLMEPVIAELFADLPAIAIDGPKAVGKTWIARRLSRTSFEFDKDETRLLFEANSKMITLSDKPVLLDEWQKAPASWDVVRRAVDDNISAGQYLLTGSAYPKKISVHSGAGRIVHVRLHPLSLQERLREDAAVSIGACFSEGVDPDCSARTDVEFEDYISEILRSGFPGIYDASERSRIYAIESYIENMLTRETDESGYQIRKPDTLRHWLKAYASATGTDAGYTEILDSATPGERNKPAKGTANTYRDMLTNLWLLEELDPWLPLEGNFNRLKMTPKHYLTDPAIDAALLGIDRDLILSAGAGTGFDNKFGSITGRLFESLVAQSLRTYATVNGAKLNFIKTLDGSREVDFIVSKGAKAIGIEVKLSSTANDGDVKHLNWLETAYGNKLVAKIIITTGRQAYVREQDGVIICPAALLGA